MQTKQISQNRESDTFKHFCNLAIATLSSVASVSIINLSKNCFDKCSFKDIIDSKLMLYAAATTSYLWLSNIIAQIVENSFIRDKNYKINKDNEKLKQLGYHLKNPTTPLKKAHSIIASLITGIAVGCLFTIAS